MKLKIILLSTIAIALGSYLVVSQNSKASLISSNLRTVAITQIVDHPSLNQARIGVMAALNDAGYQEGKNLKLTYETPHGNLTLGAQIANKLNHQKPDVIVAISTPSSQTMLAANSNHIPIVFSSVTDPLSAKLVSNLDKPGSDITGSIETPPIQELLDKILRLLPNTKTIGIIYNPGEANSAKSVSQIKSLTTLEIREAPVSNSLEVSQAVESIAGSVDLIILPSDNTVWSALETLTEHAKQHQIPVFANDPDSVHKGVTLALGYPQYAVGYNAGEKVVKILNGESPNNIPVTTPAKKSLYINLDMAQAIKLPINQSLLNSADLVVRAGENHGQE
ncbi:MAG: ABC transporter substrate-binding protein [Candidatus Berkiellales bacterium]